MRSWEVILRLSGVVHGVAVHDEVKQMIPIPIRSCDFPFFLQSTQ